MFLESEGVFGKYFKLSYENTMSLKLTEDLGNWQK